MISLLKFLFKVLALLVSVFVLLVLFQHGTKDFGENARKEYVWVKGVLPFLPELPNSSVVEQENAATPPDATRQE